VRSWAKKKQKADAILPLSNLRGGKEQMGRTDQAYDPCSKKKKKRGKRRVRGKRQ